MNFFAAVRIVQFILNPPKLTIQELATGLCALPVPKQRIEAPKKAKSADLYVIDEARNEFGFNFASSVNLARHVAVIGLDCGSCFHRSKVG